MKSATTFILTLSLFLFAAACGGSGGDTTPPDRTATQTEAEEEELPQSIQEGKGIGMVKNVNLTEPLDEDMIEKGKAIYEMKCASCHKLNDQRVVGPGWEGITNRRRPEWIMNMTTNVNMMLAKDPEAQKLLEECLTRMPDQGLSVGDARDVLEYMRFNDMERAGAKDQAVES